MKNYIGNNNDINKKKYKKSLPPNFNPDAGNVEHNIDMFNKVSDVGDMPSSASGMNGVAESYQSREDIIAKLKDYGKNYNFSKYSDAQLYAMLNRLQNQQIRKKERQDRINLGGHALIDDPSYNFDDPDREGEYQVENLSIRDMLNKLDHKCIDEDLQFYDLRSLYENVAHTLSSQEKTEIKNLLNTTNDPDAIKAYIDSKDPDKKKTEQLVESEDGLTFDQFMQLANSNYMDGGSDIIEFWDEDAFNKYVGEFGPMTKEIALKLMKVMKESYSVQSNSTTDSVDVIDDETKQVVSRHRGDNAADNANHEKDVLNMNEDLSDTFTRIHDKDEINWQMHNYDYEPFYRELRKYLKPGETWEEEDEHGYPLDTNVSLKDLFSRMPRLKQKVFMKKFVKHKDAMNMNEDLSDDWIDDDPSFDAFDTYSLQDKIFDFLDIISSDSNYDEMIEAVSDEFEMSPDKVEDYVNDYLRNKEAEWHDTADMDEAYFSDISDNKKSINEDANEFYTRLIDSNPGPALQEFMDTDLNDVTFDILHSAIKEFAEDLSKFPKDDSDIKYDCDKDRFYTKYLDFAEQCGYLKKMLHPTGYGKTDFVEVRKKELCDIISNRFPYGWKVYKGAADRQINEDYIESEDDWGDPYTYKDVYSKLSDLTNDFSDKEGTVRCWQEQEKIYGTKVLKKFYDTVEVSDGKAQPNDDVSWVISYSNLKDGE